MSHESDYKTTLDAEQMLRGELGQKAGGRATVIEDDKLEDWAGGYYGCECVLMGEVTDL